MVSEGMLIVGIAFLVCGFLTMLLGYVIWKKQKIHWTSSYSHVKKRDTAAFTKAVGQSTIGSGIALVMAGILLILNHMWIAFIVFGICVVISLILYHKAQVKYNDY